MGEEDEVRVWYETGTVQRHQGEGEYHLGPKPTCSQHRQKKTKLTREKFLPKQL